ncbi:hypothetical protein [Crateriforma spongiae]|uniref:hypothetical protein n=1 Tax=Crateriforma spongiae TaxID=2724528 RepID=UPI0039B0D4BC
MLKSHRLLDQLDRSQRQKTNRRREDRMRRRNLILLVTAAFLVLVVLSLPSLVSHTGFARSFLQDIGDDYDLDLDAEGVRVGWLTPLQLTRVTIDGRNAESRIRVDRVDTSLTAWDLVTSSMDQLGAIDVRGLRVDCLWNGGRCGLEDDLHALMQSDSQSSTTVSAVVRLQEVGVNVHDVRTDQTWSLNQSNAEITIQPDAVDANASGVLREPGGSEGSVQADVQWAPNSDTVAKADGRETWKAAVDLESLPLSIMALIGPRLTDDPSLLPEEMGGELTGQITSTGFDDGVMDVSLRGVKVRNFVAAMASPSPDGRPTTRRWGNELATLSGDLVCLTDSVVGRDLTVVTDFARVDFDGAISNSTSFVDPNDHLLAWFRSIAGRASAEIDLARLDAAMPGVLPMRDGVSIVDGRIVATAESLVNDASGGSRSRVTLRSEAIRARTNGGNVDVAPVQLTATVAEDRGTLRADEFRLQSTFARATGGGDLRRGQADVQVDFGKLAETLQPIFDLSESPLRGTIEGQIDWNVDRQDRWRLRGNGRGSRLALTLPDGGRLRRDAVDASVEATGLWDGQTLSELDTAIVQLRSDGVHLSAELQQPTRIDGGAATKLPLRLTGNGPLGTLHSMVANWTPSAIASVDGSFQIAAELQASAGGATLRTLSGDLRAVRVVTPQREYQQNHLDIHFAGDVSSSAEDLRVDELTVKGDTVSAALAGRWSEQTKQMEMHWRADLRQLQGSVRPRIAASAEIRQASYQDSNATPDTAADADGWLVDGYCEGRVKLAGLRDGRYSIDTTATGSNIAVIQPPQSAGQTPRTVWFEPDLKLDGRLMLDSTTGVVQADHTKLTSGWFTTELSGPASWQPGNYDVRLKGPTSLKMDEVARLLTTLTGTPIAAAGQYQTPVAIRVGMSKAGDVAFDISGDLGWESAAVGGVDLGPAQIPFHMTETTVTIDRSSVPVGDGAAILDGAVDYRPGPIRMRLTPGQIARQIRVTPEMADRWLKYVAPVVADAARIQGTFDAYVDVGDVNLDQPADSHVAGRLDIVEVQMLSGPMTTPIIAGLDQLRGLTGAPKDRTETKLVSLPAQQVDFELADRMVTHRRLVMQVDQAQIFTGGRVHTDGRLNLVAQVPLNERWLGSDLRMLNGQTLRFPISGTIWQPQLDNREMARALTGLGQQAASAAAENYLDRGRQKINSEINRGIERLNESLNLGPILGW